MSMDESNEEINNLDTTKKCKAVVDKPNKIREKQQEVQKVEKKKTSLVHQFFAITMNEKDKTQNKATCQLCRKNFHYNGCK